MTHTPLAAGSQCWVPAQRAVDIGPLVLRTSQLLAARVPLTLLLDLADPSGPHSHEHYLDEGGDLTLFRQRVVTVESGAA